MIAREAPGGRYTTVRRDRHSSRGGENKSRGGEVDGDERQTWGRRHPIHTSGKQSQALSQAVRTSEGECDEDSIKGRRHPIHTSGKQSQVLSQAVRTSEGECDDDSISYCLIGEYKYFGVRTTMQGVVQWLIKLTLSFFLSLNSRPKRLPEVQGRQGSAANGNLKVPEKRNNPCLPISLGVCYL